MTSKLTLSSLLDTIGEERRPDFIGIGSEKCGTTWLWDRLREHPDVGLPEPKELRFFATPHLGTQPMVDFLPQFLEGKPMMLNKRQSEKLRNELRILAGTDEAYLRIFGGYAGKKVVGEVSPQYCALPREGVAHLKRVCGPTRILLMMRDPVQRMISGAKMKAAETGQKLTDDLVARHMGAKMQQRLSGYSRMLAFYRDFFPPELIFTGFIDDIRADPAGFMRGVLDFLGLPPAEEGTMQLDARSNEGSSYKVGHELERKAYEVLREEYDALAAFFPDRVEGWRAKYLDKPG